MKGLNQLSDRVFYLPFEKETDRPNIYYIRGDDYSISIDAGNSKRHVEKFYAVLKENNLPLPKYTVISHWHWDHTFGICALSSICISSRKTKEKLKEVQKWKWTLEDMKQREEEGKDIPFCTEHILIEYPDLADIEVALPEMSFEGELKLDLGGIEVECIARDSTHSRDAVFVYLKSEKILILEDADCEDFYHGNIYDQGRLKDMLAFLESLDYQWHCVGHAFEESREEAFVRLKGELK